MAKTTILSGGGIRSNKNVKVSVKAGPARTNIVSPASADQLGQSLAFKRDALPKGTAPQVAMGNATALTAGQGPGAGRTVMKFGSQGVHGPVAQGEAGIQGTADRGNRAILGNRGSKT
jgi:hypothetical protein